MSGDLFWDQLLLLIEEGRVVPVVGQELLMVRGAAASEPYTRMLAGSLGEYLGVSAENLPSGAELETIAERYLVRPDANRQSIYSALKSIIAREEEPGLPTPLVQLAEITDFNLFLTTTFDSLLVRALDHVRFGGHETTDVLSYSPEERQDIPRGFEDASRPCVYHLFGRLSARPSYVVTQEDRLEFVHSLQSGIKRPERLFDLLNRRTLLVLGNNFGGWLARFFIRMPRRERLMKTRDSVDYVVDTVLRSDENLVFFLRHLAAGIEVFDELGPVDFVAELHRRWMERHADDASGAAQPRVSPKAGTAPRGSVFLSYASEDREAATRIRDALDAQVDVFFDKEELDTGDANWEAKLVRAIRESELFVPIISRNTIEPGRRFFKAEWHHASEEARKAGADTFIVPVIIDDTPIEHPALPASFRVPQVTMVPDGRAEPRFVARMAELYRQDQKGPR